MLKISSSVQVIIGCEMKGDSKTFTALFLECAEGQYYKIIATEFHTAEEKDAREIADDIALLERRELIYLAKKE